MLPEPVSTFLVRHARALLTTLTMCVLLVWVASHYFHPLQPFLQEYEVYTVIIVTLAAATLAEVVELRHHDQGTRARLFARQRDAASELTRFIEHNQIVRADLIEYSTGTTIDLLDQLRECGCQIRLLMKNPETEAAIHQRVKIELRLIRLVADFGGLHNVDIRCYAAPGSLRGRKLNDRFISVGWYTYSADKNELYGHTNCMVSAYANTEDGDRLKQMFDKAFNALWEHPETLPAAVVLKRLERRGA